MVFHFLTIIRHTSSPTKFSRHANSYNILYIHTYTIYSLLYLTINIQWWKDVLEFSRNIYYIYIYYIVVQWNKNTSINEIYVLYGCCTSVYIEDELSTSLYYQLFSSSSTDWRCSLIYFLLLWFLRILVRRDTMWRMVVQYC